TARRAVRGIEVVYHEAAVPSVARSVADPELSHRTNATATLTMLVAARDAGVRRFIYAGSSSVYGDTRRLPKREDMEPRPLSPYAVGKLVGEHYLRLCHHLYGLETLTLRQLLEMLGREIGVPARAERRPARAGDIRHSLADISAAQRLLGYRPKVDVETGLRLTVEWYRGVVSEPVDEAASASFPMAVARAS